MKAKARNLLNGNIYNVVATTDSAASSYNIPVWIINDEDDDDYKVALGQVNFPVLGYEIYDIEDD